MKKIYNKNSGISLITLIITIIVIIILAAIVIFTGLRTPDSAQFAKFTQDVDNVQTAVRNKYADLKTKHAIAKEYRTDEQIYIEIATAVDPGQYASMGTTEVLNGDSSIATSSTEIQNIVADYSNVADGSAVQVKVNNGTSTQTLDKTATGSIGMELPKVREYNTAWYVTEDGRVFNANGYAYNDKTYFDAKTYYGEEIGSNGTKNANRAEKIYDAISSGIVLAEAVPPVGTDTVDGEAGGDGGSGGNETTENLISKVLSENPTNGYVGYYADIDNNGTVDGIIYADLLVGNTGSIVNGHGRWNNNDKSDYDIPKISDTSTIKDYVVSSKTYTGQTEAGKYESTGFGVKDVLVPAVSTEGTLDRFYIMTLTDFTNNSKNLFYWYYNAFGKLDRAVSKSSIDFGSGKENTINMLNDWNNNTATYGVQTTVSSGKDYIDLWGAIQDGQYDLVQTTTDSKKWFIPSKSEWAAFGGELGITKSGTGSYSSKGLSDFYWSSSQRSTLNAYSAYFYNGYIYNNYVYYGYCVRLSATF